MNVRAKFWITGIEHHVRHQATEVNATVKMAAVYANDEINKSWSKYTPSGTIQMQITNPGALEQFEVGKEYYIDFTPVDAAVV